MDLREQEKHIALEDWLLSYSRGPIMSNPQRVWLEKTIVSGRPDREEGEFALGKVLWSPQRSGGNADIYKNMRDIKPGDRVFHLINNKEITGVSEVASGVDESFKCLRGTQWDDGTGEKPGYLVRLKNYNRFENPIGRKEIFKKENEKQLLEVLKSHSGLFYNKDLTLRQGAYITEIPRQVLEIVEEASHAKNGKSLPGSVVAGDEQGQSEIRSLLRWKKQVILYGPPGTGKTYNTRKMAMALIENLYLDGVENEPVRAEGKSENPLFHQIVHSIERLAAVERKASKTMVGYYSVSRKTNKRIGLVWIDYPSGRKSSFTVYLRKGGESRYPERLVRPLSRFGESGWGGYPFSQIENENDAKITIKLIEYAYENF